MSAALAVPRRIFLAACRAVDAIHFDGIRHRRDIGADMPVAGAPEAAAPEIAAPETAAAGAIR
jgi:hypothetical protein